MGCAVDETWVVEAALARSSAVKGIPMTLGRPLIALAAALSLSTPALADPVVGSGPVVFLRPRRAASGHQAAGVLGWRTRQRRGVGGRRQSFRGEVGGAYLGRGTYFGPDMKLHFDGGGVNFGAGGVMTSADPKRSG